MKWSLAIILGIFGMYPTLAQQKNPENEKESLRGKITDSATRQGVEYATVTVYQLNKAKPVNGTTTNAKGVFSINGLPSGEYRVTFEFIGYAKREIQVTWDENKQVPVNLGTIALMKKETTMQSVTVTAQRGTLENKIDKLVYNAEKDVTAQGGVATDLLKKIPMISVDVDGNVELQGNSNIRFLINGKPSSIFGNSLSDALQAIPASQIKSIEVITSPGARYDAEGTGGIINIILKDSRIEGINGNISLAAGTRLENGSLNLHAKKGKFALNGWISGNAQVKSTTITGLDRTSIDTTSKTNGRLLQNGQSDFHRGGYESGIGFEFNPDKRNTITGSVGYDHFSNNSTGFSNQQQLQYDNLSNGLLSDFSNLIHSSNHFLFQSVDWNLNMKHNFPGEDHTLEFQAESSNGRNHSEFMQSQGSLTGDSVYSGNSSVNTGRDRELNLELNYARPIGEKVKLEIGGKTVIKKINSITDVSLYATSAGDYNYDTSQSNSLSYNRNIYALYGSLTFPLGSFLDVKTGLRYERTENNATFSKVSGVSLPGYNFFAPSIVISHNFGNGQTLKMSYSRRLQRPGYRFLNPFVNASDPKNLSTGNPYLQPEIGNNFEIGYLKSFEKGGSININLFYRRSAQDIQPYLVYYPSYQVGDSVYTNVSVNTFQNIGTENNTGLNLFGSVPLSSKFTLRSNISFFHRYIENGIVSGANITSFNYRINLTATWQLNKDFIAEAFGNFNSPRNEVQGRFPSFTTYNFAFRKQLWNKKGSIGFTTTNPFNKYVRQETQVTGTDFVLHSLRQLPFRSFGISFTWKFGKLEFKKEKEPAGQGGGEDN